MSGPGLESVFGDLFPNQRGVRIVLVGASSIGSIIGGRGLQGGRSNLPDDWKLERMFVRHENEPADLAVVVSSSEWSKVQPGSQIPIFDALITTGLRDGGT